MPTELGSYSYTTSSTDPQLNGIAGSVVSLASNRNGPVRLSPYNPQLTAYASGKAYVPVGDCAFFILSDKPTRSSNLSGPSPSRAAGTASWAATSGPTPATRTGGTNCSRCWGT